jgi:hypothetical protein
MYMLQGARRQPGGGKDTGVASTVVVGGGALMATGALMALAPADSMAHKRVSVGRTFMAVQPSSSSSHSSKRSALFELHSCAESIKKQKLKH